MFILISFFLSLSVYASPTLSIFACEPEWASLSQTLGGDRVAVVSATAANQDPHYVRPRPQLITAVRNADLIVCSGGGLEAGWLPPVIAKAGSRVQLGSPNFILAATYLTLLDVPVIINRSFGDIHAAGNPHTHLDPYAILTIAKVITDRLQALDPQHQAAYQARYTQFITQWTAAIARWERQPVITGPVIVHHVSFRYFLAWLNIPVVGTLEPQPGIPPNTRHLSRLLDTVAQHNPVAILRAPYDPPRAGDWLAKKTGVPVITLPYTVGGDAYSTDLITLYDRMLDMLAD